MTRLFESYVNTQYINGICVPLPIQTNFIRVYCDKNKFPVPLPACEILLLGNYVMLEKSLSSDATDLLMISNFLIPSKKFIGDLKLKKSGLVKRVHFILERDIVELGNMYDYLSKKNLLNSMTKNSIDVPAFTGKGF